MKKITVSELESRLKDPAGALIIDVREPVEYQAERLEGTRSLPLSNLKPELAGLAKDVPLYLICRSGSRAGQAAESFEKCGYKDVRVLDGGLKAWSDAGKPLVLGVSSVWSLERQVRCAAGLLVLIGAALAWTVDISWIGLPAFVGAGLVFAAVTDTCGMAMILARMPWNQRAASCRR